MPGCKAKEASIMCPMQQCNGNIGNCEFCSEKADCILLNILNELQQLKQKLAEHKA
jgi:hypothetical protein